MREVDLALIVQVHVLASTMRCLTKPSSRQQQRPSTKVARQGRAWHAAHEITNLAAMEAAVEAGLAVAVFLGESVNFERLRELTEKEGFPRLPRADVLLHSADRYLSRATVELRNFLLARLADPLADKRS